MKKVLKNLVAAGMVTGIVVSNCLMVFGADDSGNTTGWRQNQTGWYYQDNSGFIQNQWKEIDGAWYYFNQDGYMLTGWQNLGGAWYYLGSSGAMHTGWLQLGDAWYYMDGNGVMVTGDRWIDGKDYYFNADGSMDEERNMEKFIGTFLTEEGAGCGKGTIIGIDKIEDGRVWGTYYYSYHNSGPNDISAEAEFKGVEIKDGRIEVEYDYNYVHTHWGDVNGEWGVVDSDDGEGTGTLQLTFVDNDNGIFDYRADLNKHCSIQVNILNGSNEIPNDRVYPILEQ